MQVDPLILAGIRFKPGIFGNFTELNSVLIFVIVLKYETPLMIYIDGC